MITVGPFTILCERPEDAAAILRLFGKTATPKTGNILAFPAGTNIRRTPGTKPRPTPVNEVGIAEFMGRTRPAIPRSSPA